MSGSGRKYHLKASAYTGYTFTSTTFFVGLSRLRCIYQGLVVFPPPNPLGVAIRTCFGPGWANAKGAETINSPLPAPTGRGAAALGAALFAKVDGADTLDIFQLINLWRPEPTG